MVPSQSIQYIRYQERKASVVDADTIVETPVSLTVNGSNWLTFMCTPILLEELAIGFLLTKGSFRLSMRFRMSECVSMRTISMSG